MNVHPSVDPSSRSREWIVLALLALAACERKPSQATQGSGQPISAVAPSTAASTPAPSANAAPAAALSERCGQICENSRKLGCKNMRECQSNCVAMGSLRPCVEAVTALYTCLSAQPSERWECAEDGVAAIREGFCESEQERAVACMDKNLQQ
jgi:hypothetical protein